MTICSRVGDGYPPPATVGSEGTCFKCGHKIHISNTTVSATAQLAAEGRQINHHCMNCAMEEMISDGDKKLMELTPEQRKEIDDGLLGR